MDVVRAAAAVSSNYSERIDSGEEITGKEEELICIRNVSLCRSGGNALPTPFLESLSGDQVLKLWGIQKVSCSYVSLDDNARSTIMLRIHSHGQPGRGTTTSPCPLQENDMIIRVLGDPITSLIHVTQLFRFCDALTVDVLRKSKKSLNPSKIILETYLLPSDDKDSVMLPASCDSSEDQRCHYKVHRNHVLDDCDTIPKKQSHHEEKIILEQQGEEQQSYAEKRLIQRIRSHIHLPEKERENPTPNTNASPSQQELSREEAFVLPPPDEANPNQQPLLPPQVHGMQQQHGIETQQEQPRFLWFNHELNDAIAENSSNINHLYPYIQGSRNLIQIPTDNSLDTSRFSGGVPNRARTDSMTSINNTSTTTTIKNKIKPLSTAATANLPTEKTKVKRLWPNSSIFQKRIMKWIPPEPISDIPGVVRFRGPVQKTISSTTTTSASSGHAVSNDDSLHQEILYSASQTCSISDYFRDASHIVQEICPHLLEEARVNINDEFHSRSDKDGYWLSPTYLARLQTVTPVDTKSVVHAANSPRTYEFGFQFIRTITNSSTYPKIGNNNRNNSPIPSNLGDVFAIHCETWTKTKCCIGIVGSHDVHSTFLQDQKIVQEEEKSEDLFNLWLCSVSKDNERTGWLSNVDMPIVNPDGSVQRQVMHILFLGSVITTLREFDGLKGLSAINRHLQRAIFCANLKPPPPRAMATAQIAITNNSRASTSDDNVPLDPHAPSRPSSLSQSFWNRICAKLNQYQAAAIEKFMSGKIKENVFLLQGPPGSGKTEVVLNLISALLNGPCPQPGAWKSSGIAVRVGSSLSKSKGGSDSPSKRVAGNVKTRILLCAPSNIAVDDLACRIHDSCIGPSGRVGGFVLVRFGLLPGEERTDQGRKRSYQSVGASNYRRANSKEDNAGTKRDEFLHGINLDLIAKSSVEKRNILANAHVVCTTLNSSGSKSFIDASLRDDSASEYDVVIIDEACQASEPSSLIPFKFNPKAVILVGDPQQLPVTIRSQSAGKASLGRSLFQRLHNCGWPVEMLRIQYRMRPEIVQFPSNQFYDGQLITPNTPFPHMPWHSSPCLPPFLVWNVRNATMTRSSTGGICNHIENQFIIFGILSALEKVMLPHSNGKHSVQVGIISFYNDQVSLLKSSLAETTLKNKKLRVQVSTVDGFQGLEKDIIILSCVRARGGGVGFLSDYRRVNVALTRAKHSLWIVGDCDTLYSDAVWRNLIDDASNRCLIRDHSNFWNIFNNIHSPSHAAKKYKRQFETLPKTICSTTKKKGIGTRKSWAE